VKPAADVAEVKQVANVKPAVDVEAQKRAGKWGWGEVKKQPTSKGKGQLVPEVSSHIGSGKPELTSAKKILNSQNRW